MMVAEDTEDRIQGCYRALRRLVTRYVDSGPAAR